jgi:flotillin
MAFFEIAGPNEALIISGKKGKGTAELAEETMRYKIVTGDRAFVWPIFQASDRLSLDLRKATVPVSCYTTQGIPVVVTGVVAFKVGDDYGSIANAARRFLEKEATMEERVHELFAGHVRGIVGSLRVEDLIRDREALTKEAREATGHDMEKMGLIIDSLQIAEIDDPTGYIERMAAPQLAEVEKLARVAQANNNREASERESQQAALVAEAARASEIKQANAQAEVDRVKAEAQQAGPRADAEARKAVVEQQTEVAQLEAERRERELETEVRRPADAEAYRLAKEAEGSREAMIREAEGRAEAGKRVAEANKVQGIAEADVIRAKGEAGAEADKAQGMAEADVIRAKGEAEGTALEARGNALERKQEAIIAQQVAEQYPEIGKAMASAFHNVDSITLLDGADGMTNAMTSVLTSVGTALGMARGQLNGRQPAGGSERAKGQVPA